jgi:hypothetical protein
MLADPALRRWYDRKLDCKMVSGEYKEAPRERMQRSYPGQRLKGLPTEVDVDLTFEEMFSGCVNTLRPSSPTEFFS